MQIKQVRGVTVPRHDIELNWNKAINFKPARGEVIIYDPDDNYDYARIKIGNGVHNVIDLPFFVTKSPADDDSEAASMGWVKEYVEENTADIIYLNTREYIGKRIELPDVYPVQHSDSTLNIVSKNRLKYTVSETELLNGHSKGGVLINVLNDDEYYVKVTGKATSNIQNYYYTFGEAVVGETPGKYTLCVSNEGVIGANKQCYVGFNLVKKDGSSVQSFTQLGTTPITIDSKELGAHRIIFKLFLSGSTNVSFDGSNSQSFKVQVEFGDHVGPYTEPVPVENLSGRAIKIYGRNLFDRDEVYINEVSELNHFPTLPNIYNSFRINNSSFRIKDNADPYSKETGVHYYKCEMIEDNIITLTNDNNMTSYKIKTPLLHGDEFTMIFNVISFDNENNEAEIIDVQIVLGHTDYEEYQPLMMDTIISKKDGLLDITELHYPYSLLSLDSSNSSNDGLAIYIKYDPALSRDWTEKQLSLIYNAAKTNDMFNWKRTVDFSGESCTIQNYSGMLYDKFILEFDVMSCGQRSIDIDFINPDGSETTGHGAVIDASGRIIVESYFDGFSWRGRVQHIARDDEDNLYKAMSDNIMYYQYCEYNPVQGIRVSLYDIDRNPISTTGQITLYSESSIDYKVW